MTGHRAEAYRSFLGARFPAVEIVHNPDYGRTGSMRSLHIARDRLADDFLLLESAPFEYDDCLSAVSATHPVHVHCVDDLLWGEIDDAAQYQRAIVHLLPALRKLEAHVRPP